MFRLEKFSSRAVNPQQYWDDKYKKEQIGISSQDEFRRQRFWPLLAKYLEPGKQYLDVGCGTGGWMLFLKGEGYDVAGVDIAAGTVRALLEHDSSLTVQVAGMATLPYPDRSLDGVLAIGTLEYVENGVSEALLEVNRVLSDGGFFFLEVPIANTLRKFLYMPLRRIEKIIKTWRGQQPVFANYLFDRSELKRLLRDAGFMVLDEQAHELSEADRHYGLYIDWPFLRGGGSYRLNALGLLIKKAADAISPWIASTGVVLVAQKRVANSRD